MDDESASSDVRAILIVDDDDAFRFTLKESISRGGMYRICLADSGEAALEALRHDRFDVIVLDYRMPGISGLNVLQRMHEEKMDTPVVMLTAAGSEHVAVEAMKMGAYDYVRKDQIDTAHLRILIDGVVERYLFRKEKERREMVEREREKSLVAIEMFHMMLASLAQIVDNSLSIVALRTRQHEKKLRPLVAGEGQQRLTQVFGELTQEHWIIKTAVKSMLDMANDLHGNFTEANYIERMQELNAGNLKNILERGVSNLSSEELDENEERQ
jgi:DNA-binding response OmpR family regulator